MRRVLGWGGLAVALLLSACASSPTGSGVKAPVETRGAGRAAGAASAPGVDPVTGAPVKVLPGAENAGKPGYHTVQPGETLSRIAKDYGQRSADLTRWNKLENPNLIEVGQVLRVVPPGVEPGVATAKGAMPGVVETRPLEPGKSASGAGSAPTANASAPAADDKSDEVEWQWPAEGAVFGRFGEGKNNGVLIDGKAGDPVYAAFDGRVIYAGTGLRGYGNLVIIKHNNTYLTAYAHNQTVLVKVDQAVRRGQKIAEMGSTEAPRTQLHFEVRRGGKPVDPLKFLPAR